MVQDGPKPGAFERFQIGAVHLSIVLAKGIRAALTPTIQSYFFWSFIMYLGCGLAIQMQVASIHDFFCKVAPQKNTTTETGLGCENCPDKLLLCTKPQGIRSATNITYHQEATSTKGSLYQAFAAASADPVCNSLVESSSTVTDILAAIQNPPSAPAPVESCKTWWCGVLLMILTDTDLSSANGQCTNTHLTKRPWDESVCVAETDRVAAQANNEALLDYCLIKLTPQPTAAPPADGGTSTGTPSPPASTPAPPASNGGGSSGGASSRRVYEIRLPPSRSFASDVATIGSSGAADLSFSNLGDSLPTPAPLRAPVSAMMFPCEQEDSFASRHGSSSQSVPRWLQASQPAPPASGAANDDLPDYETTEWTACSCYFQCIRGVETRLVTCGANACKDPEPPSSQPCTCNHCADCDIKLNLEIISISFLIQGLVACLVFLSFLYFESKTEEKREDALVRPRWLLCPLGFFCKTMPPLVRIFMLANFFQLVWILVTTWIPSEYFPVMVDCGESSEAKLCSGIITVIWTVQLVMGRIAKLYTRQPPYLYQPERPGGVPGIRQLRQLLRSLGP